MAHTRPIALIDSGLGGLTVARAIHARLPNERLVYFGDTARLPYGNKSPQTVSNYVRQIIAYLRPQRPKHVVIACNTATAVALPMLRREFPDLSISGVIDPGAAAAVAAAGTIEKPAIAVIATEATIRSDAYSHAIIQRRARSRLLFRATPLLVPIIEDGRGTDDPLLQLALEQYLVPLLARHLDVLLLGCTHYPLVKPAIEALAGPTVRVIDSADECAQDVARRLGSKNQTRTPGTASWLTTYVTDNSPKFAALAQRFLGMPIDAPVLVDPDDLYSLPAPALVMRKAS